MPLEYRKPLLDALYGIFSSAQEADLEVCLDNTNKKHQLIFLLFSLSTEIQMQTINKDCDADTLSQ